MNKLLMFIALLVASETSATEFCDGFKRGYEAVRPLAVPPVCTIMPTRQNRPRSDYEFGYVLGVESANGHEKGNQTSYPAVDNNRIKECNCGKSRIADYIALRELPKNSYDLTPKQQREAKQLEKLRREAETEALNAQIRQSKATGFEPKPKLTKSLKKKHDEQLKELNNEARNVKALIAKLGSGGNQETRQRNYDVAIAAFSAYVKNAEQFFDDWTDPKYTH